MSNYKFQITTFNPKKSNVFVKNGIIFGALILLFFLITYHLSLITISAEPNCDSPGPGDIDFCLEKLQKEIDALAPAHEYNKKELSDLRTQLSGLTKRISTISVQVQNLEKSISAKDVDLAYSKAIFEEKANNHYRLVRLYDP